MMEPSPKKVCLEKSQSPSGTTPSPAPNPTPATFTDLSDLEVVRVLSTNDSSCSVALEAKHGSKEGRVLVQLQKTPFEPAQLAAIVSGQTTLTQLLHNDIYSKHTAAVPPHLNKVSATLIHPATDHHFGRYEQQLCSAVQETPQLYSTVSLPYIQAGGVHSIQWIYNILEGSSEADRVILRDEDPDTGFVLVPDLKWTGEQMADLYCQALVLRRDLRSLRDLRAAHLPLLKNVVANGTAAIEARYGVPAHRLRVYLHYLPSFYHLHLHFAALTFDAPGTWAGRAHLVSDVISNLELDGDHYAKATLGLVLKDNHPHPLALLNRPAAEATLGGSAGNGVGGEEAENGEVVLTKEQKDCENMKRKHADVSV